MKPISNRLMLALAMGALVLQGCATAGSAEPNHAAEQAAIPPAPVAVPATQAIGSPAAAVPEQNGKPVVRADTKENFDAVVAAIHQQMQPGGRWQYIDNGEGATIDGSFADMRKLYEQFGSVDKMDRAARARLLADQNTVNAILTKKDGDRLICQSEIPVGSHLPVKTCKTYAQIEAEQGKSQEFLRQRNAQNSFQKASGH